MRFDSGNFLTRLLLSLCGLLTLIIVAEQLIPVRADAVNELTVDSADAEFPTLAPSRYVHANSDDFEAILERPIFFKDRKLPAEAIAEPAATPAPLRLQLEGVAIAAESRVAVLRDLADNHLVQLAEGMSHNGWTLESVNADNATFRRGGQTTELTLDLATSERRRR